MLEHTQLFWLFLIPIILGKDWLLKTGSEAKMTLHRGGEVDVKKKKTWDENSGLHRS